MRIAVFGASGKTGRHVISQALEGGHHVTAFVREPAKLGVSHERLSVVQGDVGDAAAVARGVAGQEAVLSALGVGTPLQHDQTVIDGIGHIVRAMEASGVRRLVYLSTSGVRESSPRTGLLIRLAASGPIRREVRDHEIKESVVRASALDWTIARAPLLTNGRRTGQYRAGEEIAAFWPLPMLSRADVAEFMLSQLADARFVRQAPSVMH